MRQFIDQKIAQGRNKKRLEEIFHQFELFHAARDRIMRDYPGKVVGHSDGKLLIADSEEEYLATPRKPGYFEKIPAVLAL